MSGGVDSSVAALLLQQKGFEVIGLSLELYSCDRPLGKGCCTPKDRLDARRICEQLKIAYDILDLRSSFKNHVIDYFAAEYAKGRTPLPCAPCNRDVRFKAMLDYADSVGAYWIATGHYARVAENDDGTFSLWKGIDPKKDQSYFLWGLSQKELARLQFPIGDFTKEEIRNKARAFGLVTSDKPDSQELCFVGDEEHSHFLEEHYPQTLSGPGDFVDVSGVKLGHHRGIHAYTVGQRRGLNLSFGERRYVVALDAQKNEIVLGSKEQLRATGLIAKNIHWIDPRFTPARRQFGGIHSCPPAVWQDPRLPAGSLARCTIRIRSTHKGILAGIKESEEGMEVLFDKPQEAITPGQAAVFYDGALCLGGGWIERGLS